MKKEEPEAGEEGEKMEGDEQKKVSERILIMKAKCYWSLFDTWNVELTGLLFLLLR